MHVILLGPIGSGKGTQAAMLAKRYDVCHISSGELFRQMAASGSDLGRELAAIMASGAYVPDELTVRIVCDRLARPDCVNGAILDGFPRTPAQAQALAEELRQGGKRIDRAILIDVPEDVLIDRLTDRWISRDTGQTFNPKTLGQSLDDIRRSLPPGDELYQREDDKPEAVKRRLQVYREQTLPLIDHYRQLGILHEIDGNQPVDRVQADVVQAIEGA